MPVLDTYMDSERVGKLVEALVQCAMMLHIDRSSMGKLTSDQAGDWIRLQLKKQGFASRPGGLSHVIMDQENFDRQKPPQYLLDLVTGYKALSEDYRFGLQAIVDNFGGQRPAEIANTYLGEGAEDSRAFIIAARKERERA